MCKVNIYVDSINSYTMFVAGPNVAQLEVFFSFVLDCIDSWSLQLTYFFSFDYMSVVGPFPG